MNKFDQFVKHTLKIKHYARYTDDFTIVAKERVHLENILPPIKTFLLGTLHLTLHPKKVQIRVHHRGADFLGYVILPHHIRIRTSTKERILRKTAESVASYEGGIITKEDLEATLHSYLGVMSHADAHRLMQQYRNQFWV
jgi:RNA-directed DNA polymerase